MFSRSPGIPRRSPNSTKATDASEPINQVYLGDRNFMMRLDVCLGRFRLASRTGKTPRREKLLAALVAPMQEIAMSDLNQDQVTDQESAVDTDAEYEEITSEEVDRIVESLDKLIESVSSENIKHLLEEAAASIYYLVYEDDMVDETVVDQAA
jgi:hypothetical protein